MCVSSDTNDKSHESMERRRFMRMAGPGDEARMYTARIGGQ